MYVKIVSLSAARFKPKATKAGGAISSSCHENWHDGKTPEHHENAAHETGLVDAYLF